MPKYNAVKGVQDILPPDVYVWQRAEALAAEVFAPYGFEELRVPIMESTDVFVRSIGQGTDIVDKEMYTFADKAGRSISLRPEATAPVVRCYVQRHLYNRPAPQKYYYMGPMFRYERPQSGRFRQFHQIGVEAFGSSSPETDAEVVSMLWQYLLRLGLKGMELQVNSIGCPECRPAFTENLKNYFSAHVDSLCEDCCRRLRENPLRILDCKVKGCGELKAEAPRVGDSLCGGCSGHFGRFTELLEALDVPYTENHALVRGLDYYTRTTFEVLAEGLGAQNAVAAGGRYDGLVADFGGPGTPAVGFAIGMERLVLSLGEHAGGGRPAPALFIAALGAPAAKKALALAAGMRQQKGLWVEVGNYADSLKSQMKRADKFGAGCVLFLGDDELASGTAGFKDMSTGEGGEVALDAAVEFFTGRRGGGDAS